MCRAFDVLPIMAFPAGAGMNRRLPDLIALLFGVPRRRGDEPAQLAWRGVTLVRSPQARG